MNAPGQLALFAAALVAVFALAFGVGRAVGPLDAAGQDGTGDHAGQHDTGRHDTGHEE